ncbi:MAG: hypothetical protein ACR2O0_04830 [Rhizobiaceae bacterium]
MTVEQATNRSRGLETDHSQDAGNSTNIHLSGQDEIPAGQDEFGNLTVATERTVLGVVAFWLLMVIGVTVFIVLPEIVNDIIRDRDNANPVVSKIIQVESNGCTNAKNKRSTASGPGQFIEATWLNLIRKHRPDLAHLPRKKLLDLRHDMELSREMTARFAEGNAKVLRRYGQAVTPGTLYLSHFAGSAGAVAILTAEETADAATIMAGADASGRITRDKIVNANPFLREFTIADLKVWADRKMLRKTSYFSKFQSCRS